MNIRYRDINGVVKEGQVLSLCGVHLVTSHFEQGSDGLSHRTEQLIGPQDVVDYEDYLVAYETMGGVKLYDDDGDPIF